VSFSENLGVPSEGGQATEAVGEVFRVSDCHRAAVENRNEVYEEHQCDHCGGSGQGGLDDNVPECQGCGGSGTAQWARSIFICSECGQECKIITNAQIVELMDENERLRKEAGQNA
jgi:hypothetical protein